MFFSVISYYTKLNKKTALNCSETKNIVKNIKKPSVLPVALFENIKNKLKNGVVGAPCPLCLRVRA